MERVETLLQKLQAQLHSSAGIDAMLLTAQQLQSELMHLQQQTAAGALTGRVAVVMPAMQQQAAEPLAEPVAEIPAAPLPAAAEPQPEAAPDEKIVEVLQVDEAAIEAELEEIKRNAAAKNNLGVHARPVILFDTADDIPTLTHQQHALQPGKEKEINDAVAGNGKPSLNDALRQASTELGAQLTEAPIRDLKKAIGVNDRYLFINELFRGDETMYERSIKTINGFTILAEAEYWIQRELKVKLGWNDGNETVKQFAQLVKRRFS